MSLLTAILKTVGSLVPDSMVDRIAREYFNHRFRSLGAMTTLQIDSAAKRATCDLELKGETQAVHVNIGRYELSTIGGKTFLEIHEVSTSREWLTMLAQQMVKGRKFEVPEALTSVL
ncbi:MAG TPA: hypothetical protein VG754_09065 [Verrucomicrobiae bacterium]|nr:hypothetical protein [Verrucomicrobiae bacterium]